MTGGMNVYIEEQPRIIPITYNCDVLVVGGGTAGVIAALAAAETGARTVLLEKNGFLGGTLLHGAICLHSFFNLFRPFPDRPKVQLVRGIPERVVQAMVEAGGCPGHLDVEVGYDYDSVATTFDPEIFKKVAFDLVKKAGIRLLLHTFVVDTITKDGVVKGVIAESKSGREAIMAKVVIDATGDADVAFRAGAECIDGHLEYPVANIFGMGNVDLERLLAFLKENKLLTHLAYVDDTDGNKRIIRLGMNLRGSDRFGEAIQELGIWGPVTVSHHEGELTYINCTSARGFNAIDRDDLTEAEVQLRSQIADVVRLLQRNVPGFEGAFLDERLLLSVSAELVWWCVIRYYPGRHC